MEGGRQIMCSMGLLFKLCRAAVCTCCVDEVEGFERCADLMWQVRGHGRDRLEIALIWVVAVQPPKQLECVESLVVIHIFIKALQSKMIAGRYRSNSELQPRY